MNGVWAEILSDYNRAKQYLWGPKGAATWRRDEEQGRYYMWKAHHAACEAEPKDVLLFGRILAMMADESRDATFDHERYHKYVKPALVAYELAVQTGQHPTDKELERIRFDAGALSYVLECERKPYEEQLRNIRGHEKLADFNFHDSKPLRFEHTEDTARLTLKYGGMVVTFLFEGVSDLWVNGDPSANWITDFCCYPCFHSPALFTFDIEYYKIICSSVSVESIQEETK